MPISSREFLEKIPQGKDVKPILNYDETLTINFLIRLYGHIKAIDGLLKNPEIAQRISFVDVELMKIMEAMILTLQVQELDWRNKKIREEESGIGLKNQLNEARGLVSIITEEKSKLQEAVEAKDKELETLLKENEKLKAQLLVEKKK